MLDADRFKLLYGPYRSPKCHIGDKLGCEYRGRELEVGSISGANITWPCARGRGWRSPILCGDLIRAVKTESEIAVAFHWGVDIKTVLNWRRALGVPRADYFAAARLHSNDALAALARKIEPRATWETLVLPDDTKAQLREISRRAAPGHRGWEGGGFSRRLSQGRGVNALFAGPPGTGKTMAAEVVARDLELDLYKVDLAQVVSKWIGETEKNLDRLFEAAEGSSAVLLFDEADALFGKRSEVHDAPDRYANIETAYLLQKMEEYGGISLLATNVLGNMDEAFARRLAFIVHFPFPDEPSRLQLWRGIWPADTALADDIDFPALAGRFKLSGGHIRNIAVAAAFLAADEGCPVRRAHLLHAVRREYQKMGKVLSDAELELGEVKP